MDNKWSRAARIIEVNTEAIERFEERIAEVHPDGNRCDTQRPCGQCAPLLMGQVAANARIEETVAAMPKWSTALINIVVAITWPFAKAWIHVRYWFRRRRHH